MKQFRKILTITSSLLLVFSLTNCEKAASENVDIEEKMIPVSVTEVVIGDIDKQLHYMGNVEASKQVMVYSTIPTKVTKLNVDVNDVVQKGDILATVDNIKIKQGVLQAEAGLASARAQYENAKTEWKRIEKLFKEKAVSQAQYDAVKAQKDAAIAMVNQLKAGLQSAKEQLKDTYIKAPISGIISARNYNLGDQTAPQMPAFVIVQMEKLKVFVDLVEKHVGMVKAGDIVYITVSGYPNDVFSGKIFKVYPTVNPMTRTVKVEILLENSDMKLKPGMYASVDIVTETKSDVVLIPKHAIMVNTSLKSLGGEVRNTEIIINRSVFVIKDNKAIKTSIDVGITNDGMVEILNGLNVGDEIVTIGQYNLTNSSKVQITK